MKVLFLISGLGMGNSTRCHAIISELNCLGAEIEILTSGNGSEYFQGRVEVNRLHEMVPFRYGSKSGRISVTQTRGLIPEYRRAASENTQRLEAILDSFEPDIVVSDSFYAIGPLKKRNIPIVAINNADFILISTNPIQFTVLFTC